MGNARILRDAAQRARTKLFGGTNAPDIWVTTLGASRAGRCSIVMLEELHVVITPGSGFGACGGDYIRISASTAARTRRKSSVV
jgi:LL-diaminopimelate aminotransferase